MLGILYDDGSPIKNDPGYIIQLEPWDTETSARLRHFNGSQWADTAVGTTGGPAWSFEWFDPKGGGICGGIDGYGDLSQRGDERHRPAAGVEPSGKEKHCLMPGRYNLTIEHNGNPVRSFQVDYVPIRQNLTVSEPAVPGGSAVVEALDWDATNTWFKDLVVNVDLNASFTSESRDFRIENAYSSPFKSSFVPASNPSGDLDDYFRFSVGGSSVGWSVQTLGRGLARLYFNFDRNHSDATGYYDTFSQSSEGPVGERRVIRLHQFLDATEDPTVALEIMQPNESPQDTNEVTERFIDLVIPSDPPTVSITGPTIVERGMDCMWQSTAQNGTTTSRQWQRSKKKGLLFGPFEDIVGETGAQLIETVNEKEDYRLRVEATYEGGSQPIYSNVLTVDVAASAPQCEAYIVLPGGE